MKRLVIDSARENGSRGANVLRVIKVRERAVGHWCIHQPSERVAIVHSLDTKRLQRPQVQADAKHKQTSCDDRRHRRIKQHQLMVSPRERERERERENERMSE